MNKDPKIGDPVWYVHGNDRERAKIVEINGNTEVTIELVTGVSPGRKITAPWGIVQPENEAPANESA